MSFFKKTRKYYWLIQEFIKRHYRIIVSATLIGIISITAISFFARYLPTPKKHIRIARIGKFAPTSIPEDIQQQVSKGLITMDTDGNITPGIAKEWKITNNDTTYTFTLDSSLRWHDSVKLKPEDIKFAFKEVSQEYTNSEIIFHLKEPFAPFMGILSEPILKKNKQGIGEYKITSLKAPGGVLQSITLIGSNIKKTYKFYPTENTAITAYRLGEVDRVENISFIPKDLKEETNTLITKTENNSKIAALFFNNNDTTLSGKSARQALTYAIQDKSGTKDRAISPINKNSWAFNPNVKEYEYDPERAIDLFNQDVENPSDIKIEIKTMLQYLENAEKIARDWEEVLGIKTEIKVTTTLSDDFQAILIDYTPPIDPDQYTIWHSTQPTNFTNYQNLKIDKLLEDGRRTLEPELRKQIYQDFQRFLLEDSPAAFLFYSSDYTIERKPLINL